MTDLSGLKRLCAYYIRHHVSGYEGLEEEFIDVAANEIQDRMPTADIERIRPFMIDGNVNEWIPLGQAIDAALNPAPGTFWTEHGTVELTRERSGKWTVELDGETLGVLEELHNGLVIVERYKSFGRPKHYASSIREACNQLTTLWWLDNQARGL